MKVADGSIFGLHLTPPSSCNHGHATADIHMSDTESSQQQDYDANNNSRRKRVRKESFPVEHLPEELVSFATPPFSIDWI